MPRTFMIVLITLTLGTPAVHADPAGDARRAIQAAYNQMNAAAEHKNPVGALAYRAPGSVSTEGGHATPIAQERVAVRHLFASAQSVAARSSIQSLTLNGAGTATVLVKEHLAVIMAAPAGQQKTTIVIDDTARDLWVRTSQGWRQERSQDQSHSMTINGRSVPS